MSGVGWHIFAFGAVVIFLVVIVYRTIAISRLPVHLRWELAPIPHEKGKGRYGGSYLEEGEWWLKRRRRSLVAPVLYMGVEILLLRSIWRHNRALWPLSYAFHAGIYLIVFMLIFSLVSALLTITGAPPAVIDVFLAIASVLAVAGYIIGAIGAIGLILKRALDTNLRPFNTFLRYFNLAFLAALFITGAYAWFASPDFAAETSLFIKGLVTLDTGVTLSFPLSMHVIISLIFIIYLPLTDMIHFVAKYFTYHAVRWNDEPKNEKMVAELNALLDQSVSWSAVHVRADGRKNWAELTADKTDNEKES
jgi:nitrate reductase gamma subunit